MQALVLVGGRGTRLLPITEATPKPVITLVDRPFLAWMLGWLAGHGVDEVVLSCGFLPDRMKEVLGDGIPNGPRLIWVEETEPMGTAGAMRFALEHLDDRFLALNGDLLSDFDLSALVAFHQRREAKATIGLKEVQDTTGFGLVDLEDDGTVSGFREKAGTSDGGSGLVNSGVYVLEREVIEAVEPGREVSIEREVFPRLAGPGLAGLVLDGYWMDIGTPDRYLQATWDIVEGRMEGSPDLAGSGPVIAPTASVAPGAKVGPRAVVSSDCVVEEGAEVSGSVMLEGSRVGTNARVIDSILASGAVVDADEAVSGAVIGQNEEQDDRRRSGDT
jgi:mannose-1-phosphate guanylyltransferase